MSNYKWKLGYVVIVLLGVGLAMLVRGKTGHDERVAMAHLRALADYDSKAAAQRVQGALTQIYQNIRTIGLLPSVRKVDRHGTNLGDDGTQTIQQIYNNLYSNVAVSEVYLVPVDLNADRIDPVTSAPEAPIVSFDGQISDDSSAASDAATLATKPEEVEIYEYRLLRRQQIWLKQHYPTSKSIDGLNVPVVSGAEVLTCDNTVYGKTRSDADRRGFILSVPFYGMDGVLRGSVSAITRTKALQAYLPLIATIDRISGDIVVAMERQSTATHEIATNIEQASEITRQVASRIAEVSVDAASAGRQATNVQTGSARVADSVRGLRGTLTRIARTGADENDRRQERRIPLDEDCMVEARGRVIRGRLQDLSVGGASLARVAELDAGSECSLRLSWFARPLPAVVLGSSGESGTRLAFSLEDELATAFEQALDAYRPVPTRADAA